MISKFTFRLLVAAIALSPALLVNAQSKPVDSVIVKVGSKSRIIISIGDPGDVAVLRRYDVDGLIDDLIRRVEDRETKLPPAARYSVDSLVSAAREQTEHAVRELEKEIEVMERDLPRDGSRNQHMERMKDISAALERLSRLQARLAMEQSARKFRRDMGTFHGEWQTDWDDHEKAEADKEEDGNGEDDSDDDELNSRRQRHRRTFNSFNIDLGTNNYLSDGKFIDSENLPYTLRPLGSWYVAGNSTYRTRLANRFFLEWGAGLGFYNFKFLNDSVRVTKNSSGIAFPTDQRDLNFRKSKLTAYYAQVFLVPVLDFGGNRHKPGLLDDRSSSSFRIGIGPYAGYRIDSYAKQSYRVDGDRQVDRRHDNFYLNNLRYGLRLQLGFRNTDLFFNYDLNELFTAGKAPALNAFSFGISF